MADALASGRKKGGGGGGEAADTLRSVQIAELAILVSEGECRGLVNGLKSVYIDGVAIENADGSLNFQNVQFAYTVGTQGQAALPGLSSVQSEIAVGLEVPLAVPVVRTVNDPAADAVRVTIGVPQLTEQNLSNGSLAGSSFEWAIDVQSAGGGFVQRYAGTVSGKATSRYARSVRVQLAGAAPWDIRVRRVSPDAASNNIVNRFFWDSYTVVQTVKLRYPNSAVAMLRVNAQNFSRLPTVGFDWLGQLVPVPSNYNPITRVYTGVWDGTFKLDWTNNPAWIYRDAVTHPRYGLGRFVDPGLNNKWSLYSIAQYCDGLVPNGRGGMEPRFTCNAVINTRQEAFNLLRDLATTFRGMVFWANSQIDFAQDAPGEAELLYTPANVVGGDFSYSDTNSERQLHSTFLVRWNDMSQLGRQVVEVYADPDLVARWGVREVELTAFGCWSRGQAARVARWAAYAEQFEGELVTFSVGADGIAARPGRLFKVADPNEAGERLGGRIRSATATQVELDAPVVLAAGETYTLSVLQPGAAQDVDLQAERRTVTTAAGSARVLQVAPPFSSPPAAQTVWLLESDAVEATWWRCLGVEETVGQGGKTEYRVIGVRHERSKFGFVEEGLVLERRSISRLTLMPAVPPAPSIIETTYLEGVAWRIRASISWLQPQQGLRYRVAWRLANGPWVDLPETSANTVDVDGLQPGLFEVSLSAVNALENASPAAKASRLLTGNAVRPRDVEGLAATVGNSLIVWSWLASPELDYQFTELRLGVSWEGGQVVFSGRADRFSYPVMAAGGYRAWAKHFNTSRLESLSAVAIDATVSPGDLVVGTPGANGLDGRTSYFHTKWSNDGGSTFTAGGGEVAGAYIGTYSDFTPEDSANPADYTWALVKGADGTNGAAGTNGLDGRTTYLHVKWSNDGGSTFTANGGETPGAFIGTYTDFVLADSPNPADYTWALVKGADGTNGLAGEPGADGLTSYLHIKWSNDGGATFSANAGETPGSYIGTYTDFSQPDSNNPADYNWALVKGADGVNGSDGSDGRSVYTASVWLRSSSPPAAPVGGSFSFATGALVPPVGWLAARPAFTPAQATWEARFLFVAPSLGATVVAGEWGAPVRVDGGGAASPVDFGVDAYSFEVATGIAANAYIRLNPDGTVDRRQGSFGNWEPRANWYVPTTPGVGSSFRLRTTAQGDPLAFGAVGAFVSLGTEQIYRLEQMPSPGYRQVQASLSHVIVAATSDTPLARGESYLEAAYDTGN